MENRESELADSRVVDESKSTTRDPFHPDEIEKLRLTDDEYVASCRRLLMGRGGTVSLDVSEKQSKIEWRKMLAYCKRTAPSEQRSALKAIEAEFNRTACFLDVSFMALAGLPLLKIMNLLNGSED